MITEIWKDIKGYENLYRISSFGNVYSNVTKRQVGSVSSTGYWRVCIRTGNKQDHRYIHQLVWEAFGDGERDGNRLEVDHIDNDPLNNRIDNLQLLDGKENIKKRHQYTADMIEIAKKTIAQEKEQGHWERKLREVLV